MKQNKVFVVTDTNQMKTLFTKLKLKLSLFFDLLLIKNRNRKHSERYPFEAKLNFVYIFFVHW